MMFPAPCDLKFDSATGDLVSIVEEMAATLNKFGPLPSPVVAEIQKRLLEDRVYNSNAMEGNTLSLRETQAILATGAAVDVGRRREATEVVNLGAAIREVQTLVDHCDRWSDETVLLSIHGILMKDLDNSIAGQFRTVGVMIRGAKHQPPGPEKLFEQMAWFRGTLADSVTSEPIRLATWTHWAIARIHPFQDGNGRMARLWQDLILFGHRYSAAIISVAARREYYNALAAADEGRFDPLAQMIGQSVANQLQASLDACHETDELKCWAQDLAGEAQLVVEERRRAEYMRWSRGMLSLRDAFARCAGQIASVSDGTVEVQCRPMEMIAQPTWESLRSGTGASKTWFFWLHLRKGESRIQYCFFFGTHYVREADADLREFGPQTSLLVSEQVGQQPAERLDIIENHPLRLREILVSGGGLQVRYSDPATGRDVYRNDLTPVAIAQEFISQSLLQR